jgi:hypothetical protein
MGATLKYGDWDFGPQKTQVKAYARGGPVKKEPGCGCGGPVNKAKGGTVTKLPATPDLNARALERVQQMQATKSAKRTMPASNAKDGIPLKKGGEVVEKETGERYPSKAAMDKHEASEDPVEHQAEMRVPGKRKGVPVMPRGPLIVIAMEHSKPPKK